ITPAVDAVIDELYEGYLGPYWEPERKLVEVGYRTVAFPFPEIAAPPFEMKLRWNRQDLVGYLGTWSPLQKYAEENGASALEAVRPALEKAWGGNGAREVAWPLSVRAFRV